jgi:hypothetical protein
MAGDFLFEGSGFSGREVGDIVDGRNARDKGLRSGLRMGPETGGLATVLLAVDSTQASSAKSVLTMVNLLLALLSVVMIIRDGRLWVLHRRPYRLAFMAFWVLLLYSHVHRAPGRFMAIVLLALVAAMWLKQREYSNLAASLKHAADGKVVTPNSGVSTANSGLWDREFDGHG